MALEPALRRDVRRIVQELHRYARERGWEYAPDADWSAGDYHIDVVVNVDWPRIYVVFAAKGFRGQDGFARFESAQNHLRSQLPADLVRSVVLVVMDPSQRDREGEFPLGMSDERVDEEFVSTFLRD